MVKTQTVFFFFPSVAKTAKTYLQPVVLKNVKASSQQKHFAPENTIDDNKTTAWRSKKPQGMIEYSFDTPKRIAMIEAKSFETLGAPKKMVIWGSTSKDCKNRERLLTISDAGYTKPSQTKIWKIPKEKRKKKFSCMVLDIKSTNQNRNAGLRSVSMLENVNQGKLSL